MSGTRAKLPPVEGVPATRPACAYCRVPLKWVTDNTWDPKPPHATIRRVFVRWNGYGSALPLFCTLRCALRFAVVCYQSGVRMKKE